ncbi:hypothetical protein VNI00_010534 [Paramarasmius palmivorus]|uniref:Uncharacterized protein n=1 Tax=Paramarasmius palmivorus TaxID=297713 RepID=A0AAW0CIN1_9AGAR
MLCSTQSNAQTLKDIEEQFARNGKAAYEQARQSFSGLLDQERTRSLHTLEEERKRLDVITADLKRQIVEAQNLHREEKTRLLDEKNLLVTTFALEKEAKIDQQHKLLQPGSPEDLQAGGLLLGLEFREVRRAIHRLMDCRASRSHAAHESCQDVAMGADVLDLHGPARPHFSRIFAFQLSYQTRFLDGRDNRISPNEFSPAQSRVMAYLGSILGQAKIEAHQWKWDLEYEDWVPLVTLRGFPPSNQAFTVQNHPNLPYLTPPSGPSTTFVTEPSLGTHPCLGLLSPTTGMPTRQDIWIEYSQGFEKRIPIRELDRLWGMRWLPVKGDGSASGHWHAKYAREVLLRRNMARLVEELCVMSGPERNLGPLDVLRFFDKEFAVSGTIQGIPAPTVHKFLELIFNVDGLMSVKRKWAAYIYACSQS